MPCLQHVWATLYSNQISLTVFPVVVVVVAAVVVLVTVIVGYRKQFKSVGDGERCCVFAVCSSGKEIRSLRSSGKKNAVQHNSP